MNANDDSQNNSATDLEDSKISSQKMDTFPGAGN